MFAIKSLKNCGFHWPEDGEGHRNAPETADKQLTLSSSEEDVDLGELCLRRRRLSTWRQTGNEDGGGDELADSQSTVPLGHMMSAPFFMENNILNASKNSEEAMLGHALQHALDRRQRRSWTR